MKEHERAVGDERNKIVVSGEIISEPKVRFSTDTYSIYQFKIKVVRISGAHDELLVQADEKMIKDRKIAVGEFYKIFGDVRTYKNINPDVNEGKLLVCVSAKVLSRLDAEPIIYDNDCTLHGVLKRKREIKYSRDNTLIREFVLEVRRDKYSKVYYIPCVGWKGNAELVSELEDGISITCKGRLQSREYRTADGDEKVCYEVAVKSIDKCADEQRIDGFGA